MLKLVKPVELHPIGARQKSFYGKALVYDYGDGRRELQSYDTTVCRITATGEVQRLWDGWSATTQRHINSFLRLYGYENLCGKANWNKLKSPSERR